MLFACRRFAMSALSDLPTIDPAAVTAFITRWKTAAGGSERANYQLFIVELCQLLGVPSPDPSGEDSRDHAYVCERRVVFRHGNGSVSQGFIDCYKRGCFVLEAKGSRKADGQVLSRKMEEARSQAQNYARALPADSEGRPPFLLIVDVGKTFELYAEFTRSGAEHTPFPDAQNHRIPLAGLARPEVQARLRALWLDPMSLDPSRQSARATREIADMLAQLAKRLETRHPAEEVAAFLTRCLFTFFAEDMRLLPERSFTELLESLQHTPELFVDMVENVWSSMDTGGFCAALRSKLLHFNGKLFKTPHALALDRDEITALVRAGRADWTQVEPAIFGALLERALNPDERHSLGAHYTPRAYVERLVLPTVIEPLRRDWENVRAAALLLGNEDKPADAVALLHEFHYRLCHITVLDPACGSGNFLYVALEHIKRLEGEVLDMLHHTFQQTSRLEGEGLTVDPHQFLGLELNPRAAAMAELVLWIGYLQWHFRTHGHAQPPQPVLRDFKNIECRDAVLSWSQIDPLLDANGQPCSRWDGKTWKTHPVTGERVPDDSARLPLYRYQHPRPADWPPADFIIGNPPFIGAGPMRAALGDGYVEALRSAYPDVPDSADLVMFWWEKAANAVRAGHSRRFGLITTNSLKQTFNRRVVQRHLQADPPLKLSFAIPDHPWVDSSDGAAVRIAMTVGSSDKQAGVLQTVTKEWNAGGEGDEVTLASFSGEIYADLKMGVDMVRVTPLESNANITSRGLMLFGSGFILDRDTAQRFNSSIVRPYVNGRDLTDKPRGVYLIDTYGFSKDNLRDQHPEIYQWLLVKVKPERDQNKDRAIRENWWLHGRQRPEIRKALQGLPRFIATVETAKHRIFQFMDAKIAPDNMLVVIAHDQPATLGVLSSRVHALWALAAGGTLEDRPRYNKTRCFETFPFPVLSAADAEVIGALAEKIDAHRKKQQAAYPDVTLTGLYNVLEKQRRHTPLNAKEKTLHAHGLAAVLNELHNELDAAVLEAYGWQDLAGALLGQPGALTPLVDKPDALAEAEETLLARLAALNAERAREEQQGHVRWLRPDFQAPHASGQQTELDTDADASNDAAAPRPTPPQRQPWPSELPQQVAAVAQLLEHANAPMTLEQITACFTGKGKWKQRVPGI
ncbi:class I SAM-dependent DNA methyltransferase, partial [Rivihabitans pingtungensis]|uniref:class I SAM-dependent DNA methyltransferase n=3 Tax=Rivihabitans pingtungensis TaxID=1054498 RepID=UPI00289CA30E